jgi:hypothetical protein
MPFDAQCKGDIDALFESLEVSLESRTHSNWATRAVQACIASKSLDALTLDEKASTLLRPNG